MRSVVSAENPGISFGEVGKQLGARWAEVDEKTKKARAYAGRVGAGAGQADGRLPKDPSAGGWKPRRAGVSALEYARQAARCSVVLAAAASH